MVVLENVLDQEVDQDQGNVQGTEELVIIVLEAVVEAAVMKGIMKIESLVVHLEVGRFLTGAQEVMNESGIVDLNTRVYIGRSRRTVLVSVEFETNPCCQVKSARGRF